MPFVWIIRTWCSIDTFWEAVRSSKEYDIAHRTPDQVVEEIELIIRKEQQEWKDICSISKLKETDEKDFSVELPTVDQVKSRPFCKFLSVTTGTGTKDQIVQNWYVERLTIKD